MKFYFYGWYDAPRALLRPSENPTLVYELRPGARVTTAYLNPRQRAWRYSASVNRHGFRGEEVDPHRHTPRVIVLGDSYTFGYGVDDDETFSHLLERKLRGGVGVLNWGVPGYNFTQAVELLASKGKGFKPNVVVLAQHFNDFEPSPLRSAREVRFVLWSHLYSLYRHAQFLRERRQPRLSATRQQRVTRGFEAFDQFVRLSEDWGFSPILFPASCRSGYDHAAMQKLFVHSISSGVRTIRTDAQFCGKLLNNLIPNDGHPTAAGHTLLANELLPHLNASLR